MASPLQSFSSRRYLHIERLLLDRKCKDYIFLELHFAGEISGKITSYKSKSVCEAQNVSTDFLLAQNEQNAADTSQNVLVLVQRCHYAPPLFGVQPYGLVFPERY